MDIEVPECFDGEFLYLLSLLTDKEIAALVPALKNFVKGMLFSSGRYTTEQFADMESAAKKAKQKTPSQAQT